MQIELAKPGMYGQKGQAVTEKDLAEVAETFQGDAPIVLGHSQADWMPRFGDVKSVIWDPVKKVLTGEVSFTDTLKQAIDEGFYKKWSISAPKLAATGKRYLHHLAFLGATPPCIRDLKALDGTMINMADAGETWTFGDDCTGDRPVAPTETNNKKENTMPEKSPEQLAAEQAAAAQAAAGAAGTQTAQSADVKNLSDQVAGQQGTIDTLTAQLRQGKIETLKKAMAGRIPQAKHADVIALADSLPLQADIELADDKGVKSKKSPLDLLIDIVGAIAMPVQPGRMNLGDPPAGGAQEVKIDIKKMMAAV